MNTVSSPCPNCGGPLPAEKMAEIKVFNCEYCRQLIHPTNCFCEACSDSDLAGDYQEAQMGLSLLALMKENRRKDEAERARLGLPAENAQISNATIIIRGPQGQKICAKCGNPF